MHLDFNIFIQYIEDEFEDIEKGQIKSKSLISDFIEINSLNTLVISIVFESEYNQSIPFEKIKEAETFGDLFKLIEQ